MKQARYGKIHKNVDAYIRAFPAPIQTRLRAIRKIIQSGAPYAKESISYNIPAYKISDTLAGRVLYFAGYAHHIGIYPASGGDAHIQKALSSYRKGKGTFQFPHEKPLPLALIKKFVLSRAKQVQSKK